MGAGEGGVFGALNFTAMTSSLVARIISPLTKRLVGIKSMNRPRLGGGVWGFGEVLEDILKIDLFRCFNYINKML